MGSFALRMAALQELREDAEDSGSSNAATQSASSQSPPTLSQVMPQPYSIPSIITASQSSASTPFRAIKTTWGRNRVCVDPSKPFVVLDFETTGLSSYKHEIIEVGAVKFDSTLDRPSTLRGFVKPSRRLPKKIVQLTGITDDVLMRQGVDLGRSLPTLLDFIGDAPIVTYNAAFDLGFLNAACDRFNVYPKTRGGWSCALRLARRTWPDLPSYRLSALSSLFGLEVTSEHRALHDAFRAAAIYHAAMRHFYAPN